MAGKETMIETHNKRMELLKQGRTLFLIEDNPRAKYHRVEIRMIGGMLRVCSFDSWNIYTPREVEWHYPYPKDLTYLNRDWKLMDDETREEVPE